MSSIQCSVFVSSPRRLALLFLEALELRVHVDEGERRLVEANNACGHVWFSHFQDAWSRTTPSAVFLPSLMMPFGSSGIAAGGFVRLETRTQIFELRFDRRVVLIARGELLLAKRQELDALVVEGVDELPVPLPGVFQALFVELQGVRVGLHADLDRP